MRILSLPAAALIATLLAAGMCDRPAQDLTTAPRPDEGAYDFEAPAARFLLPDRLEEISGVTVLDSTRLGVVQDEEGVLFVLDAATGGVVHEHAFGGDGDYEDLVRAGDTVFVLRSDGRLYRIDDWTTPAARAAHVDLALPEACDAEGVAFDAPARLLVSCKERPGGALERRRTVFAFDLEGVREPDPVFTIVLDDLARVPLLGGGPLEQPRSFKPSALARHPVTGEWFILSSTEKAILVLAPSGAPTGLYALSPELFRHPEGLAIQPDGELFVSNEADGWVATLLRFSPR